MSDRPDPDPTPRKPAPFELELPETDETKGLVERAQAGDAAALNELFTRYHGMMVQLARQKIGAKLRSKEDADDLAQTTFREATRDFGRYQYRGDGSFLRWLVQILQNKIRDKAEYYGANKRDSTRERSTESGPTGDSEELIRHDPASKDLSVTALIARDEEFRILREALDSLSDDHRKAITLVFFQGLTLREAGEKMDRSEDAVRMLLRRAEGQVQERTRSRLAK
ncbi:MAG: RNA polymerase sigma factor [Planctomycetota bacterium]